MLSTLVAAGVVFVGRGARAQESKDVVTVQSRILQNGVPVNADLDLTFEVYTTSSGGTALWSESQSGVPVRNGVIAISLGTINGLGSTFKNGFVSTTSERWLAIKQGGVEIVPRVRLTAVPYAHSAGTAEIASALWDPSTSSALTVPELVGALVAGGSAELDADQLAVTFTPSNYTNTDTPETNSAGELTAHLKGIDLALGSQTLAKTLLLGQETGGRDLVVSSGDAIRGLDATSGSDLLVRGGSSTGTNAGAKLILAGGTGGATDGTGGGLDLRGGLAGTAAGTGGAVTISTAPLGSGTTLVERLRVQPNHGTLYIGDGSLNSFDAQGFSNWSSYSYRNSNNFHVHAAYGSSVSPGIIFRRGFGTAASPSLVGGGTSLGAIVFSGMGSATQGVAGAQISCSTDATPSGTSDMPGRLDFFTTPDGSNTLQLRMRINNAGVIFAGNGATAAAPNAATISATGGSGSGVHGASLTLTGGANSGSGNSNGGSVALVAPTGNASGTHGDVSLSARGQTVTYNDGSNTSFTGRATGATSLVGAINLAASGFRAVTKQRQTSGTSLAYTTAAGLWPADKAEMVFDFSGTSNSTTITVTFDGQTIHSVATSANQHFVGTARLYRVSTTQVECSCTITVNASAAESANTVAITVGSGTLNAGGHSFSVAGSTGAVVKTLVGHYSPAP